MAGSEQTDASPAAETRRRSCALCNKHKVKCLGGIPCRHCIESKQICTPQGPGARSVLQRVASLEKDRLQTQQLIQDLQRELALLKSEAGPSRPTTARSGGNRLPEGSAAESPSNEEDGSTSRSNPQQETPEGVASNDDEEDITLIDTIRFGKRKMQETAHATSNARGKRARVAAPDQDLENMLVMEKVSLDIFFKRCAHKLPFILPENDIDLAGMRAAGSMLYWTMIAAGSREARELAPIHLYAENLAIESSQNTLFGRQPTLDDVRGLLINWMFLSEPRSPGHVVGIAHDLRLGARCANLCKAYEDHRCTIGRHGGVFAAEAELRELLRLDGYLFMIDRITAAVTDRPHLISRDEIAQTCSTLLEFGDVRLTDMRLVAQVEVADLMASARAAFSQASAFRDNITLIPMWSDHLDRWLQKWNGKITEWRGKQSGSEGPSGPGTIAGALSTSLRFLYESSRLYIHAFPLQGLHDAKQFTPKKMQCMDTSIISARSVCVQAVRHDQPNNVIYTSNMTQFQLCFAAVFLLRMMKLLPGQFDELQILGEVEDLASLLSQISGGYYAQRIFQMLRHIENIRRRAAVPAEMVSDMVSMGAIVGTASWERIGGAAGTPGPMSVHVDPDIMLPSVNDMREILDWDVELGIGAFWEDQSVIGEM